jgi:hypothetical protein
MAIVPARIGLELYDSKGGGGTFLLHASVSDGSLLSAANGAVATAATMLGTVSNAGIKQGTFTLINKAVAVAPDDSVTQSDIGYGAVFDFSNAALISRTYGQLVSSFLPSLVASNGTIDITASVQAAFVASMLAAVLGGNYTDSDYLDLVEGLDAFRTNRKLRRRLRP